VSLHCNLDDNTRHLMNKERLAMMKHDAVLVNAARGPCIDEAALVKHMQENPDFRAGEGLLNNIRCLHWPYTYFCAAAMVTLQV
jgi:lactate dehydrogenase-like 2-hydroxyacid dehydrogenase